MVDGIEGEEGFNGVVADEPEENGQENAQRAAFLIRQDHPQAFNEAGFGGVGITLVYFRFSDKNEHQQGGNDHQARSEPEWESNIHLIKGCAAQEGNDGAHTAHKVDNAVGLRAVLGRGDVGHEGDDRSAPERHAEQQGRGAGHKERQRHRQRDQTKGYGANRCANEDKWHAAPYWRAQAVRPGADRRLDEQGGDIVQRHKETDPDRGQVKTVGQKQRHKGVINAPYHTDAKKTKPQQKYLAVIKLHASPLSS
jgi:hypothetical protein